MSWWLFLPLAWIAAGSNLVVAQELTWHGYAPDFLLLLLSFVVVRPSVPRRLWQAVCLGLLMDFSGTGIVGLHTAAAVLTVALLARPTRCESDESASWLMWAFPAMCLCSGLTIAGMHLLSEVSALTIESVFTIPLTSAVTLGWGFLISLVIALSKRLIFTKDRTFSREPNSLSFFLSR